MAPAGDSVRVSARLRQLAVVPTEVVLRLRSGDGRPLAAAEVNGEKTPVLEGDLLKLPRETNGRYRIVGRSQ